MADAYLTRETFPSSTFSDTENRQVILGRKQLHDVRNKLQILMGLADLHADNHARMLDTIYELDLLLRQNTYTLPTFAKENAVLAE